MHRPHLAVHSLTLSHFQPHSRAQVDREVVVVVVVVGGSLRHANQLL